MVKHKNKIKSKYFEDFSIGDKYLIPSRTQTSGIFSMFQAASGEMIQFTMILSFVKLGGTQICWLMDYKF